MKKRLVRILIIATVVLSFQLAQICAELSRNLVSNPGFESGITGWLPKHVSNATPDRVLGTTGGSATVVNGIGRNNTKALKVTQGNQVEGGSLTTWARAEYPLIHVDTPVVGSAYLFSAWVKAESIPSGVQPSVQLILEIGADQGESTYHYQDEVVYSGALTTEWKKYTGVTRMMSFEQQDGPNTQYKGMIGFFSSPKYAGANTGFDQGILQSAPLKEFNAFAILAAGPTTPVPLLIDDVEIMKPVYNFVFDKANSDSKILFKESGSEIYLNQGTETAIYRGVKDENYFIYKLDFTSSATDATLTLNLADDYNIEISNNSNGPWTSVATGKKLLSAGAYKADEIIDLASYLKKNSENSVYVKFSDRTKGSTGTAKNGLMLRALEVFSKTGTLEFKSLPSSSSSSSKSSSGTTGNNSSSASGSKTNSSQSSTESAVSGTSSQENSDSGISSEEVSNTSSVNSIVNDGVTVDATIIKPSYTDITIDYTAKKITLQNPLTVKDLLGSFTLGAEYSLKVTDHNGVEITDTAKKVSDDMLIEIYKNSAKYTTLSMDAMSAKSNLPLILGGAAAIILILGVAAYLLYKKGVFAKK